MATGIVKFFNSNPDKRFGFIVPDDGGRDVFFHHNNQKQGLAIDYDRMPKVGDRVEFVREDAPKGPKAKEWEFEPYVSLGDIAHSRLGDTTQNIAYYFTGLDPYPNLARGLQTKGDAGMYHSLKVHRDDVETFVARVKKWNAAKLANRRAVLVYTNEKDSFFFSNRWQQPDVPTGFIPVPMHLPHMVPPRDDLPDGMVTNREELVRTYYANLKEIPNPNPKCQPAVKAKPGMFHYSGYWGSWSRVLSTNHPHGPFVEVNLTPIPGSYSSTWDNHVRPIRIRFHGTARDHSNGGRPMSDKDVAELPKEIEQAMRHNLGNELTDRLLKEDFLSQIDYDLYAKKCNAGANFEDIKR